jgi:hypothetical protein
MGLRQRAGLDSRDCLLVALVVFAVIGIGVLQSGRWISLAGTSATIVGLAVAIGQIRLARDQITQAVTVAEATKAAVTSTRYKLVRAELLLHVSHLQQIDQDLYSAIADGKPASEIAKYLAGWRDSASNVFALLDGKKYSSRELRDALASSAKAAAEARDDLPSDTSDVAEHTKHLRAEISGVCGLLGGLQTTLKLDTEEGD